MERIENLNVLNKKYGAILADVPWKYDRENPNPDMGSAILHYPCMELEEVKKLPVSDLAKKDCVLFLWATFPKYKEALEVMEAWGFNYRTAAFAWVKLTNLKKAIVKGMGWWSMANVEPCLLGKKGSPKRKTTGVSQVIMDTRREHSRKPEEQYEKIEKLAYGPYLELFARQTQKGWDSIGLERTKFNKKEKELFNV